MNQLQYLSDVLESPWFLAHFIQSTVCSVIALGLAYVLRNRTPLLRHTILLVAMLKFLVFVPLSMTAPARLGWIATAAKQDLTVNINSAQPGYASKSSSLRASSVDNFVLNAVQTEKLNTQWRIEDNNHATEPGSSRKTIVAGPISQSTLLFTLGIFGPLCLPVQRDGQRSPTKRIDNLPTK